MTRLSTLFHYLVNKTQRQLKNCLLPTSCILCDSPSDQDIDLCVSCGNSLPRTPHHCQQCGIALRDDSFSNQNNQPQICGQCLKDPPCYQQTISTFSYQKPIDRLIAKIKFANNLVYTRVLGEMMAKTIANQLAKDDKLTLADKPDCIIPVPLHNQRLRERGYNQALELARPIAKRLQIPINNRLCLRIRRTEAQTLIQANQRYENIKNAFYVAKSNVGMIKQVAIVDDVITTGNTVRELAKVLRQSGIEKIQVWCCARAGNN